jgi:hypothetical protein
MKELERVYFQADVSESEQKPSAFIDVQFYKGHPDKRHKELNDVASSFVSSVEEAVKKSDLFDYYMFNGSKQEAVDYTIKVDIYIDRNKPLAIATYGACFFSNTLIPTIVRDHYWLKVEVVDRNGITANEVTNKDGTTLLYGVFLLPFIQKTHSKAYQSTLENQMLVALQELAESGAIKSQ